MCNNPLDFSVYRYSVIFNDNSTFQKLKNKFWVVVVKIHFYSFSKTYPEAPKQTNHPRVHFQVDIYNWLKYLKCDWVTETSLSLFHPAIELWDATHTCSLMSQAPMSALFSPALKLNSLCCISPKYDSSGLRQHKCIDFELCYILSLWPWEHVLIFKMGRVPVVVNSWISLCVWLITMKKLWGTHLQSTSCHSSSGRNRILRWR